MNCHSEKIFQNTESLVHCIISCSRVANRRHVSSNSTFNEQFKESLVSLSRYLSLNSTYIMRCQSKFIMLQHNDLINLLSVLFAAKVSSA